MSTSCIIQTIIAVEPALVVTSNKQTPAFEGQYFAILYAHLNPWIKQPLGLSGHVYSVLWLAADERFVCS